MRARDHFIRRRIELFPTYREARTLMVNCIDAARTHLISSFFLRRLLSWYTRLDLNAAQFDLIALNLESSLACTCTYDAQP